jgi:hypothetical protein
MSVLKSEIRSGVYYDSAVLMQLQRSLAGLPGVQDAGVIMGTESNKELLAHIDLVTLRSNAKEMIWSSSYALKTISCGGCDRKG